MTRRHMDWPLGAVVIVSGTNYGTLEGKVVKHWRGNSNACSVEFPEVVGDRYCHLVPFSKLQLKDPAVRGARPWYKRQLPMQAHSR